MIKPDAIVAWPRAFDYPQFRELLVKNRDSFGEVIITFTDNSTDRDLREFFKKTHPDFTFVNPTPNSPSWYHDAINRALDESNSKWVLFLEQDFWFSDDFMERFLTLASDSVFSCLLFGKRLHPACYLCRKKDINRTTRIFNAMNTSKVALDNFDLFAIEMEAVAGGNFQTLSSLGFVDGKDYHHMSGLTQNYELVLKNKYDLLTGKKEFKDYNEKCMNLTSLVVPPEWKDVMELTATYFRNNPI